MKLKRIFINPYDQDPSILEAILFANEAGFRGHKLQDVVLNLIPYGRGSIDLYFPEAEPIDYTNHGQGD